MKWTKMVLFGIGRKLSRECFKGVFKGAPIAKFWISTLEFAHETLTIGFVVPQNPGSDGWNYRFEHQCETRAICVFWRENFWWTYFGRQRLNFEMIFVPDRSNGSQGATCWQKISEKIKPRFYTIFSLKNFRFSDNFFYGFLELESKKQHGLRFE